MDTCAAGVWGALLDNQVQHLRQEGLVVVNIGNEHTFAVLVRETTVWGVYEHHTGLLTPEKLSCPCASFSGRSIKQRGNF